MGPELVGLKANEWTYKRGIYASEAPGYADPSGTDFAPESSAVCFRFHCRSIDLQYLEETFPLLGFSVRSWMVGWKRSLAKQREGGRDRR